MNFREETVKKNYIYKGKILNLRCDDALLPDGKPCKREIVEHGGGAGILYMEEGKVLLVRQFRYAYGEELYEIPAGKLEAGEDPAVTAARELEEEAGLLPEKTELLFTVYPTPGYTNEKIYIFRAVGAKKGKVHLDEGEFLSSVFVPLEKAAEMIGSGEIKDAKTIIAVQHVLLERAGASR